MNDDLVTLQEKNDASFTKITYHSEVYVDVYKQ